MWRHLNNVLALASSCCSYWLQHNTGPCPAFRQPRWSWENLRWCLCGCWFPPELPQDSRGGLSPRWPCGQRHLQSQLSACAVVAVVWSFLGFTATCHACVVGCTGVFATLIAPLLLFLACMSLGRASSWPLSSFLQLLPLLACSEWHTTCWCGLSAVRSLLHWMCSQHKLLLAGGDQKNTCEYAAGIPYVRDLSRGECVEQCRSSIHKKTLSSRVF